MCFPWQLGYLTPQLVDFLSRAGRDLFNSISAVHPFVISILLQRVQQSIEAVSSVRTALSTIEGTLISDYTLGYMYLN